MTGRLSRPVWRGEENHPLMRWYPSYPMVFGRCCAPGCGRTGASRRRSCPTILPSSNSCTTPDAGAKPCSEPSWPPCCRPPRNPNRATSLNLQSPAQSGREAHQPTCLCRPRLPTAPRFLMLSLDRAANSVGQHRTFWLKHDMRILPREEGPLAISGKER
jgi:hypothetical protein